MSFKKWMQQVDRYIAWLVGLGADDLADQCWRDWYDDGASPREAATEALANEGYTG